MTLSPSPRPTVISAPGKVLFAGGYLVLDRLYTGLVIATSSRFYTHIATSPGDSTAASSSSSLSPLSPVRITIRAGQFPRETSIWTYTLALQGTEIRFEPDSGVGRNKFIEITVAKTLSFAWERICSYGLDTAQGGEELFRRIRRDGGGMEVVVLADNDFYSQREQLAQRNLPPSSSSLASLPPFCALPRPIHQTNKTGLGSSASLVTSLIAALLFHLNIISLPPTSQAEALHDTGKRPPSDASEERLSNDMTGFDTVHSLAQYAHCLAQGKVGSGFDISSAVYGTHIYRRFSPSLLTALMEHPSTSIIPSSGLLDALDPKRWDQTAAPWRLPRGLRLMLADVDAGTDTPSFVGKVLAWRERQKQTALQVWTDLGKANDTLANLLQEMCGHEGDEQYDPILAEAARIPIEECDIARPISQILVRIHAALTLIRSYLQHMSTLSSVPIEPPSQTRLLDACSICPGVLGGGVPGAGGFDAIFLLVVGEPRVVSAVERVWEGWTELGVCPLMARQSDGGLRREILDGVRGLREAVERVGA